MARVVRFIAYSDYLCPWCWVASRRLWSLADEYHGQIEIVWRSYLLRPVARADRNLEKFREYTKSWAVPAAEEGAGPFREWATDEPPPTHSVPAHRVAKAAGRVGPGAFRRVHERLMSAYFSENRDISSRAVLADLWRGEGLAPGDFDLAWQDEIGAQVLAEHEEARSWGATGVPAIRRIDNDAVIVGAHPDALYRRWIERSLARGDGLVEAAVSVDHPASGRSRA